MGWPGLLTQFVQIKSPALILKQESILIEIMDPHWDISKLYKVLLEQVEIDPIYPTPPLGQDMTQGQFLSGV